MVSSSNPFFLVNQYYINKNSIVIIMSFRIDKDSLGEFKVPDNAYYGPFTARALEQYP